MEASATGAAAGTGMEDYGNLTKENYLKYAVASIRKDSGFDVEEVLMDDMKTISFIKRMFNRYDKVGKIKTRLLLNHFITLFNIFEPVAVVRILFLSIEGHERKLKTCFEYFGGTPRNIGTIDGKGIGHYDAIDVDEELMEQLRTERLPSV